MPNKDDNNPTLTKQGGNVKPDTSKSVRVVSPRGNQYVVPKSKLKNFEKRLGVNGKWKIDKIG